MPLPRPLHVPLALALVLVEQQLRQLELEQQLRQLEH